MAQDARSDPREQIPGVRVSYETAPGQPTVGEARDISRGGIFVKTEKRLAVGKRIQFEIRVPGEAEPVGGLGRVIWTRESAESEDRPAGMALKFIDVDEGALEMIARLKPQRDPAVQGAAAAPPRPARERTVLGIGTAGAPVSAPPRPERPVRERTALGVGDESAPQTPKPMAGRERTVLGIGNELTALPPVVIAEMPEADPDDEKITNEVSLPIELVSKTKRPPAEASAKAEVQLPEELSWSEVPLPEQAPPPAPPPPPPPPARSAPIEPRRAEPKKRAAPAVTVPLEAAAPESDSKDEEPRRRRSVLPWLFFLIAILAGAAYSFRDVLRARILGWQEQPATMAPAEPATTAPPPPPLPSMPPSASASVIVPASSAPPPPASASASASASGAPSASAPPPTTSAVTKVPSAAASLPSASAAAPKPVPPTPKPAQPVAPKPVPPPAPKPTERGDNPY